MAIWGFGSDSNFIKILFWELIKPIGNFFCHYEIEIEEVELNIFPVNVDAKTKHRWQGMNILTFCWKNSSEGTVMSHHMHQRLQWDIVKLIEDKRKFIPFLLRVFDSLILAKWNINLTFSNIWSSMKITMIEQNVKWKHNCSWCVFFCVGLFRVRRTDRKTSF